MRASILKRPTIELSNEPSSITVDPASEFSVSLGGAEGRLRKLSLTGDESHLLTDNPTSSTLSEAKAEENRLEDVATVGRKPRAVSWADEAEEEERERQQEQSQSERVSAYPIRFNDLDRRPVTFGGSDGRSHARHGQVRTCLDMFYDRYSVGHVAVFSGGNFAPWFRRFKMALDTYPVRERKFLLCSKLSDEVYAQVCRAQDSGRAHDTLEELIRLLHIMYAEPDRSKDLSVRKAAEAPKFSRVSLKNIPHFKGGDFEVWYKRVENALDSYPPRERIFQLSSLLTDEVFAFVSNRSEEEQSDLTLLVKSLRRQYSKTPSAARAKELFYTRTQKTGESMREFEGELRKLGRVAFQGHSGREREFCIIERMIQGTTNVEVARHFAVTPPAEVAEILQVADRIREIPLLSAGPFRPNSSDNSIIQSRQVSPSNHTVRSQDRGVSGGASTDRNWRQPRELFRNQQIFDKRIPRSPTPPRAEAFRGSNNRESAARCFACDREGHFRRNCPFRDLNE